VHRLQRLLLDRLDAHRRDVGAARSLEQRTGIGGIGLVALHVGADIGRRQQSHLDAQVVQPTRPVVGRATRFHHHQTDRAVDEPAFELQARQPLLLDHPPGAVGHRQLKDRLGEIHSHNRQSSGSIHLGLLLVALTPHTT
jgi:hypothetical protein